VRDLDIFSEDEDKKEIFENIDETEKTLTSQ
jgi:hypothetical protein